MEKRELVNINNIIKYMESTSEDSWCLDVVKTRDGKNCFFGHLFDYGGGDNGHGSWIFEAFEEAFATTYMIYPVNDGTHPGYKQETPKQRVIGYLKNLRDGKEMTTYQSMEFYSQSSKA